MEQDQGYSLIVSFNGIEYHADSEHAFIHGVEFGQLWNRMRSGAEAEIETAVHVENRTLIERACAAEGWSAEFSETEPQTDGWLRCEMKKEATGRGNPHGLRIVK